MNGFYLIFTLYLAIHTFKAHKIDKKKMTVIRNSEINSNRTILSNLLDYWDDPLDITNNQFTDWSSWTRCERCKQHRTKTCSNPSCYGFKLQEERTCKKKRCHRRALLKSGKMHVIKKIRGDHIYTRTMHSKIWSRWSQWSPCSRKCRTQRFRSCQKPGRCKNRIQRQSAFCFNEQTKCQVYVLELMGNHTSKDVFRYDSKDYNQYSWKRKCGRPLRKPRMLKIIGGVDSKKNKWPWHVAIQNKNKETFCGGTLIAPRWVLTAGHCLRSYLKVRFNEHDLTTNDGREIDITVQRMFLHPLFDHYTVDNDIALLRLPIPVRQPVACLPTTEPVSKDLCFVMGWGKAQSDDIYGTNILREAKIPVVSDMICKRSYKNYIITENMFCAGWKFGYADTCAGDSGGGLMCPLKKNLKSPTYTIQGITSFGDGCGRKNKYGIYTKVFNYQRWIDHTIKNYS